MERWEAKLLAMCLIFIIMEICGLLPIKFSEAMARKGEDGKKVISVITCFGGGVFFGAYLLHLQPDVREILEEAWLHPSGIDYPIPELIIGAGFFLVLCLEKFILYYSAKKAMKNTDVETLDTTGHVAVVSAVNYDTYSHNDSSSTELTPIQTTGHAAVVSAVNSDNQHTSEKETEANTLEDAKQNGHVNHAATVSVSGHYDENGGMPNEDVKKSTSFTTTIDSGDKAAEAGQESEVDDGTQETMAQTRSLVLILALSLDCLFEGLTLGLMTTNEGVLTMFLAIVSHEIVMAFCLGLELVKYYTTPKVVLGVTLYALAVPLGCAIGMIIYETQDEPSTAIDITNGVLTAIAAGCFIYVTFFGLLGEELRNDSSLAKLLAVIIGFLFMAGMAAIPAGDPDEEDPENDFTTAAMTTFDAGSNITDYFFY